MRSGGHYCQTDRLELLLLLPSLLPLQVSDCLVLLPRGIEELHQLHDSSQATLPPLSHSVRSATLCSGHCHQYYHHKRRPHTMASRLESLSSCRALLWAAWCSYSSWRCASSSRRTWCDQRARTVSAGGQVATQNVQLAGRVIHSDTAGVNSQVLNEGQPGTSRRTRTITRSMSFVSDASRDSCRS